MTREELISTYNATSTDDGHGELETYEAWLERQLLSRIARLEKLEHPLPPAEGAEEISARDYLDYWIRQHGYLLDQPIGWSIAADFAEDFAALHAQRLAEKMVRDRLKKVESLLNSAAGLVGNPGTNISGSCDVACDMWQKNYEAYLKIRESND